MKIAVGQNKHYFEELLTRCGRNFVVQRCVDQHPLMASFNASSVNTIRIVTCRIPGGRRKVLYAVVRYGAPGSERDNALAGGGFTKINNDGTLASRLIYREKQFPKDHLLDSVTNVIPNYEAVKDAVLGMHAYLPWFNRIGWDIAVGEDGVPVLIEFNIRSGVEFQQAVGPVYSDEDLDLLMERIVNFKVRYSPEPKLTYPDIPGVDTWMCSSF